MPSVGMRRTTRVFGMVKGFDVCRVLRSGRRLWPEKSVAEEANKWLEPIKTNQKNNQYNKNHNKENGWAHVEVNQQQQKLSNNANNVKELKQFKRRGVKRKAREEVVKPENDPAVPDRRFGKVYYRKRRRTIKKKSEFFSESGRLSNEESGKECSLRGFGGIDESWSSVSDKAVAAVIVLKGCWGFSGVLCTLLKYMTRERFELDGILKSLPMVEVCSSLGLQVSWDPPSNVTGICKFFGARQFVPLFSMDFSAVPRCFMNLHYSRLLRFEFLHYNFVNSLKRLLEPDETTIVIESDEVEEDDDTEMCEPQEMVLPFGIVVGLPAPPVDNSGNRVLQRPFVRASKSKAAGRGSQLRNGVNTRSSTRSIQKSRSLLTKRRTRKTSLGGGLKTKGSLVSDLVSSRRTNIPLSSVVPKYKFRSSGRKPSAANLKKMNFAMAAMNTAQRNRDSSGCGANILVIEADKGYRVEGASVVLEKSASGQWLLVVKKDGLTRYTHKPEKSMRPPACNRFTHAMMWMVDDSWKLEFPNRWDWLTFKDLFKECADHNVPEPIVRFIPIPGVREVPVYDDAISDRFHQPDSYISTKVDEVFRAMVKRTANYDMDSEDEDWLKKFNNDFFAGSSPSDHVSIDNFELMVDSFEKAFYRNPDDFKDDEAAPNLGLDFGRRAVVEAVYGYWVRKRKQKRSALVRIFELHKRPSLLPKQPPRKRRSFKRQASQPGRGKPSSYWQALATERGDASTELSAVLKVEEAKAAAEKATQEAIFKRQKAQALLECANLATYKATMALRIAEASQVFGSSEAAVAHYLE